MAEYLQNALKEHPRTRRLGELIADIAYPISSAVAGSAYIPFHASLLSGVNSIKQTSDYIFQSPYERLLYQFEESRRLKYELEKELHTTQSEYESLKVASCPVCTQSEDERRSLLEKEREKHDRQTGELREHIYGLNNRLDALLITLAQREYENEELKSELERKERVLGEAVKELEDARRMQMPVRPKIETEGSIGGDMGILTPESMREHDLGQSTGSSTDGVKARDPVDVALPEEDSSLLYEQPLEEMKEQEEVEGVPKVKADDEMEESAVLVKVPNQEEEVAVKEKEDVSSPVPAFEPGSGTEEYPVVALDVPAEVYIAEKEKEKEDVPAPAPASESEAKEDQAVVPVPNVPAEVVITPPEDEARPASRSPSPSKSVPSPTVVSLNDDRPISGYFVGADNQIHPVSLSKYEQGSEHGHSRTSSGSAIPVHKGSKGSDHGHGHGHGNVAFSSFGFAEPIPHHVVPSSKSSGSLGSQDSTRRKKHSFFGKHDAPHSQSDEKDKDKEREKPSFRSRVFSSPSHSHTVSHTDNKSGKNNNKSDDDESSLNSGSSIGHSKEMEMNTSRPSSPSSKHGRNHSFFRDHVKVPLERKASQIAHKGREFFKHESEYLDNLVHNNGHTHQRQRTTS